MSFLWFMAQFIGPCLLGMFAGMTVHEICHWIPLRAFGYEASFVRPSLSEGRIEAAVRYDTNDVDRESVMIASVWPLAVALYISWFFVVSGAYLFSVGLTAFTFGLVLKTGHLSYADRKAFMDAYRAS